MNNLTDRNGRPPQNGFLAGRASVGSVGATTGSQQEPPRNLLQRRTSLLFSRNKAFAAARSALCLGTGLQEKGRETSLTAELETVRRTRLLLLSERLQTLDLNGNRFSGFVPTQLARAPLTRACKP